jgi:hypothetical protein
LYKIKTLDSFERYTLYFLLLSIFVSGFYFLFALNFQICFELFKFLFAIWIIEFTRWSFYYLQERINNDENEN